MSYTAVVYPRFNGMYYTVRFPDFNDTRADNMESTVLNNPTKRDAQLRKSLKKIISEWKDPLPNPKFQTYDEFTSSYGDEVYYFQVKV